MTKELKEDIKVFKKKKSTKRFNQDFDKTKITLTKAGKTFNVYDKIQEAREDTEIIPTLKKYGCIPVLGTDTATMYQDFTKASDLRGVLDKKIQAENAFYNLPVEVRREFDHDIDKFMKNGGEYINKRIAKEQEEIRKQQEAIQQEQNQTTQTGGEVNNG